MQPICGFVLAVFKPTTPPVFPTPASVWHGLIATKVDYAFTVPAFIEVSITRQGDMFNEYRRPTSQEWSRDPAKVEAMKQMRGIVRFRVLVDNIP